MDEGMNVIVGKQKAKPLLSMPQKNRYVKSFSVYQIP